VILQIGSSATGPCLEMLEGRLESNRYTNQIEQTMSTSAIVIERRFRIPQQNAHMGLDACLIDCIKVDPVESEQE